MIQVIRDNDQKFLEVIFQHIRKINSQVLIDVQYFPNLIRVQIQSSVEFRGKIFNKLHHLHSIYGLKFESTQFIRKDKSLISFDFFLDI